jgi:serine/threonine protein kinase
LFQISFLNIKIILFPTSWIIYYSWDLKIKILIQISKGMEYLNFKHLIHRDLKPENVLICEVFFLKKLNLKI